MDNPTVNISLLTEDNQNLTGLAGSQANAVIKKIHQVTANIIRT